MTSQDNGATLVPPRLVRVLVAVDDAPESLRAARAAIAVAAAAKARLRAVSVIQDGIVLRALEGASQTPARAERRYGAATAVLRHVAELAATAQVPADTVVRDGDPGARIIAEAQTWAADLVVVGRCEALGASRPALGRVAQHVVELVDVPVLVVP
jgi:nucleotide-binding universal stress UspA family protein